jgi:hypothetical protein
MKAVFLCMLLQMLFSSNASRLIDRLYEWWSFSIFYRVDGVIYVVAIIGFVLRWIPDQFSAARGVYAVNGILMFMRILREYSANSRLGPKLVMILKMVSA